MNFQHSIRAIGALSAIAFFAGCSIESQPLIGMVEAEEVIVSSMIPGRLQKVSVYEGEAVRSGDLLIELDNRFMSAKVDQALGMAGAAESRVELAKSGVRPEDLKAAQSLRDAAQHQLNLAEKSWTRVENLWRDSVISTQKKDEAEFKLLAAREQLVTAESRLEMARKGARREDLKAAQSQHSAALGALREARAYGEETRLVSPISGEISKIFLRAGEVAGSGTPLLSMFDPRTVWVALSVREDLLPQFPKGGEVEGVVPALGGKSLKFRVMAHSPLADFATWRASGAKGEFDLRSFEVRLEPLNSGEEMRPGMSVQFHRTKG